jgi:hypothetical protein
MRHIVFQTKCSVQTGNKRHYSQKQFCVFSEVYKKSFRVRNIYRVKIHIMSGFQCVLVYGNYNILIIFSFQGEWREVEHIPEGGAAGKEQFSALKKKISLFLNVVYGRHPCSPSVLM